MKGPINMSPCLRIEGSIRVPGDKSISHRGILLGGIGHGPMEISNLSPAEDVRASAGAMAALGVGLRVPTPRAGSREASSPTRESVSRLEGEWVEGLDFQ